MARMRAETNALQTALDNYIASNTTNLSNIEERVPTASGVGGININYSNDAYPNTSLEVLTVSYYDDYNFTDLEPETHYDGYILADDGRGGTSEAGFFFVTEPEITIERKEGETFYEHRVNGVLKEIKVVPDVGPTYYLVPADGNTWIREDQSQILVPSWKLFEW